MSLTRKLLLPVIAALIGSSAASVAGQLVSRSDVNHQAALTENRAHFYRVIAGTETPSSPTVDNALATDLRKALEEDRIAEFQGTSNQYGGITDAIGYDPFDGSGLSCHECGPLSADMKNTLDRVKEGRVDEVIAAERVEAWHFSLRRILFGWLAVLLAFSPFVIWDRLREHRVERKMRECYGDSMNDLDEVDRVLGQVSLKWGDHPQVKALQGARDDLVRDMRASVRSNQDEIDLEARVKSMERRLAMVKDHVTARDSTLRELENQ